MTPLPPALAANPLLSQWISFDERPSITLRPGKVEIGQGILTALAQIAAEELDVDISRIQVMAASTQISPDEGFTSGSRSIEESGPAIRQVCAEVKAIFTARASQLLEIPAHSLSIDDGQFTAGGTALTSYWELAPLTTLDVQASGSVRPGPLVPGRYLGQSHPRLDSKAKVMGTARYIHNLDIPGMLHGRIVRPPNVFARLATSEFESRPGAQVVRDGSFLGVLAPREELAIAAAADLTTTAKWTAESPLPVQDELHHYLRSAPCDVEIASDYSQPPDRGDRITATYSRGYVAHASIGPSCALARWHGDRLSVWSSTQGIYRLRAELARAFKIDTERVSVQFVEGAGCYGHNGADDVAYEAALLARFVPGETVRLQWMREDELGWAPYGPAGVIDLAAELNNAGEVVSWDYEIWSSGTGGRPGSFPDGVAFVSASLLDQPFPLQPAQLGGLLRNAEPGYRFGRVRIKANRLLETPLRTSSLRSLGAHLNVFATECFMDELAAKAGADPVDFRLRHLDDGRGRAVIERAATEAGWGRNPGPDRGLGLGYARYKGTSGYCAVVAEVEATHALRVARLTIAADVGFVINPDGVANQVMGGAIQSTSWTTTEEVRFSAERVESANWETYPILRFSEVPEVAVFLVGADENEPLGAGEVAQGPAAAAIGNALSDAIGLRVREMPLTARRIKDAASH